MEVRKYSIKNSALKKIVKYIWVMESRSKIEVSNLLLPVNSIDLILNFSQPIKYILNGNREKKTEEFHINGLRNKSVSIMQTGEIYIMGVSFQPYGLFNLLNIPVSEFTNEIVELNYILEEFAEKLREKIEKSLIETEKVKILEDELLKLLIGKTRDENRYFYLFDKFVNCSEKLTINEFCIKFGISERHLERLFDKYIGVTPKVFKRITRFQKISDKILKNEFNSLSELSQEYGYFDQTHFIKECRDFTGVTPVKLAEENIAVKSIILKFRS